MLSALAEDGVLGIGVFTSERQYPIMNFPLKISLSFQYLVINMIPKTIQPQRGGMSA